MVVTAIGAGWPSALGFALRALIANTLAGDLGVGTAQQGIVDARIHHQSHQFFIFRPPCGTDIVHVELFGLPWTQTFGNLLGKAIGVGRGVERLPGDQTSDLVMTVAVAPVAAETGDENFRPLAAHDADHGAQHGLFPAPLGQSFIEGF